jgi:hypothetical protein
VHQTSEVTRLNDPSERLANAAMSRDNLDAVEDHDLVIAEQDFDGPANEAMRNAVPNRLDIDERVRRDAPGQALLSNGQRPRGQRSQSVPLLALEAIERSLVRRAVNPRVGGDHPSREMRLESGEALEGAASDGISLHVADPRLGLALCACPVRTASARRHAPVGAKGAERRVHMHDACLGVAPEDQRARIVDQHRLRDAAEVQEGTGQSLAPVVVSLAQESPDVDPSRIAQYGDEEVDPHLSPADDHAPLTKVDLELMTWRCLEAHRRHLGGAASLAMRRHCPLQSAQLHRDPALAQELPRDYRIAGRLAIEQGHGDRPLISVEPSSSRPLLRSRLRPREVPTGSTATDSERRCDALGSPAHRGQPSNLPHDLRL